MTQTHQSALLLAAAGLLALPALAPAFANEFEPQLRDLAAGEIKAIVAEPALVAAIMAQNARTKAMSEADILAADTAWRAEVGAGSRPTIDPVVTGPVAEMLRTRQAGSGGVFTEIFVMDAVGLNVAASDVTSDYWQGDEDKWQQTYAVGPDGLHISEIEQDESTQTFQSQVSVAIVDPASGAVIGAATFGVNVGLLN